MQKRGKAFVIIFVGLISILLLSGFVSAWLVEDIGNWFKKLFITESGEDLGGELKTGPGGSPSYLVCEEGEKKCELLSSRTANFRYKIVECQKGIWIELSYCEINQGCENGACRCVEGEKRCYEKPAQRGSGIIRGIEECRNGEYIEIEICENWCENGECVEEDSLLIEEDIGELEFIQSYFTNCETLDDVKCEGAKTGLYNYSKGGVESVVVFVEVYEDEFTDIEFKEAVERLYGEGATDYKIESWDENNFYIFAYLESRGVVSYVLVWYEDNKIISIEINRWDMGILDDDIFEFLIETYFEKYSSGLIREVNKCSLLSNEVILEIQELQELNEVVVLREGDIIKQDENIVIPVDSGKILKLDLTQFSDGGADTDYATFIDVLTNENYQARGNFSSGAQQLIVSGDEYFVEANSTEARVTWHPLNQIDSFENCQVYIPPTSVWLIYDEETSVQGDIYFLEGLRDWIYSNFDNVYVPLEKNNEWIIQQLHDSIGVFVYGGRVLVIQGSGLEDNWIATSIYNYLTENSTDYLVCQEIVSSDQLANDLIESLNDLCVVDTALCESCGFAGFFCDREECESIEEGCYFIDIPFGLNECNSCRGLTCSNHDEESDCYLGLCGLKCEWRNEQCVEDRFEVYMSLATEKNNYDLFEIIKLTPPE